MSQTSPFLSASNTHLPSYKCPNRHDGTWHDYVARICCDFSAIPATGYDYESERKL